MTTLSDVVYIAAIATGLLVTATFTGYLLALAVRAFVRHLVDGFRERPSRDTVRVGSCEFDRRVFDAQRLDRVRPVSSKRAEALEFIPDRSERATSERW